MRSEPVLRVEAIDTFYGDSHALHQLSLEVGEGELVCLLGRNGAGKTTVIHSIMGTTRPRSGRILFHGQATNTLPPNRLARLGVALVPQGRRIFPDLSVRENLLFAARPGPWHPQRVYELFPRLAERQQNRGDELSGGEQQMLAISRALLMNPRLILMDEPSEGLAPLIVSEIAGVTRQIKQEGISLLLVEQNLGLALSVADRCYVLNKGQIVYHARTRMIPFRAPPSPPPWRCYDLGRCVAQIAEASPWRVALIGSSSWSHAFLTAKHDGMYPDVASDRRLYEDLCAGDVRHWRDLKLEAIHAAGQHELLNWVCLAGAMEGRQPEVLAYSETYLFNSNKAVVLFQDR